MKKLFFLLAFLFLSARVDATTLGDAAAALSPGQWVRMLDGTGAGQMGNLNATASYPAWDNNTSDNPGVNGSAAPGPAYDGSQPGWNSATRKMYFQTTEHGRASGNTPNWCPAYWPIYPHGCWKPTWTYDTDTNNWNIGRSGQIITGVFPQDNSGNPQAGVHVWGGIAWDDGNQVLYVKQQETFTIRVLRFCAPTSPAPYCAGQLGTWKALPDYNGFANNELLGQALGYHRTLNGGTLVVFSPSGNTSGCAALAGYKEGTTGSNGVWSTIDAGAGCKFPNPNGTLLEGQYSTSKQVLVFSNGARKMWRLTSAGQMQALDDAACDIGTAGSGGSGSFATAAEDANTGEIYFLMCDGAPAIWKLNPTGSSGAQWTQVVSTATLTSTGQMCAGAASTCAWTTYATPIRTYGVIGFWRWKQLGSAEYWLFKPSVGGGDVIAPTVSLTAPAAGTVSGAITVSATASDNVGVVGVQFKLDGVNLLAEDTAAPFSISWNTATASNASHTLTATARDAAGNSTTSAGVTVTVSNAAGGSDYTSRCNAAIAAGGRCVPFDSSSEISCIAWGCVDGIDTAGVSIPVIDSTIKASGAGSIKFTIPTNSGANTSGSFWANFSTNLLTRYGANSTFYIQWRQRFSPELLNTIYWGNESNVSGEILTLSTNTVGTGRTATISGTVATSLTGMVGRHFFIDRFDPSQGSATITAVTNSRQATVTIDNAFATTVYSGTWYTDTRNAGGWKMASVTTGDFPGCVPVGGQPNSCFSSCTYLDVPVQNTFQRGFAQMYHSCTGSSSHPFAYQAWEQNVPNDILFQNARPSPFCTYTQQPAAGGAGNFPPNGNCFGYFPNEWMTFKVKFTVGPRGGNGVPGASPNDEFVDSNIKLWIAREGQPAELVYDWYGVNSGGAAGNGGGYSLSAGPTSLDEKYGKMYFLPYHTEKSAYQIHSTAYTWYDELIMSPQDIADPSGVSVPDTTNPTVAITSPIPPTSSSTTSPITVSGTATDNIGVTSVTWTCIQCTIKGGTATSVTGTSISWLIPALNLVSGTNTLNVVSHDAAGNVSSAATLTITYTPRPTRYVDGNLGANCTGNYSIANRSCTGSDGDAYTTANAGTATAATVAGDTLFVRAGTYNLRLSSALLTINSGTNDTTRVKIAGYPGETVTLFPSAATSVGVIAVTGKQYVWFDNFVADGTNVTGSESTVTADETSSFIRFSYIESKNNGPVGSDPAFSGAGFLIGGNAHEIQHVYSHDNGLNGAACGTAAPYGIYFSAHNSTIENSRFIHNGTYGVHQYHSNSGTTNGNIIRYNEIADNGAARSCGHGLLVSSGSGHQIYGNVIRDQQNGGANVSFDHSQPCINCEFYNNTVVRGTYGGYIEVNSTGLSMKNNIFENNGTNVVNLPGASTTFAQNLCFGTGGTTGCAITASDPLFVNYAADDFRLNTGSPALNVGVPLAIVTNSIDGTPRPQGAGLDLGAYESSTTLPVVTIVNPTANASLGVTSPIFSLGGTSTLP